MKELKVLNGANNFKVDETGTIIAFKAIENNGYVQFVNDTDKPVFKIKNSSGFVKTVNAKIIEGGFGVGLDTAQLSDLTPDTYYCELWNTNKDGLVNIYPDKGFVDFTINENCLKVEGEILPEISLSDFTKQFDDYVKSVKQGPQGPQGIQGVQGEPGEKGDAGAITTI